MIKQNKYKDYNNDDFLYSFPSDGTRDSPDKNL